MCGRLSEAPVWTGASVWTERRYRMVDSAAVDSAAGDGLAGDGLAGNTPGEGTAFRPSPAPRGSGPLAGLLVADFSRVLAGPYATMLLADLGAEVIKVEGPNGDETRTWQPPVRGDVSTYYLGINRGKRSIVLDFRDEADAAIARELAHRADVVIENFKPGGLVGFGLDFDSVRAANPAVVYASISGFGTTDGAHVPGYDL